MLRNKPTFTYNGLTIILSMPSRFDKINLLSSTGGRLVDDFLRPDYNRCQCDIRLKEDTTPLLPNTKCILLLGAQASLMWTKDDSFIGAIRGSVYFYDGHMTKQDCHIPMIASFFPQDAADIRNIEKEHNPLADQDEDDEPDEDDGGDDKARHGKTKRKNYRFWLEQDVKKCKKLLKSNGQIPERPFEPKFVLYPKSEEVIQILKESKNTDFFIDLETFVPDPYLKCFSFSFGYGNPIYCVPVYLHNNTWAYSNLPNIFSALAVAMRDNTTVAHNGQCFDFIVLPWKCGVPIGKKLYDTMIAQHRCYSHVEKSLGHCTSLWTWEPFHKDEGGCGYSNAIQARQTWTYCCKDVYTMQLIKQAIDAYAAKVPGLTQSIADANAAIRPYITMILKGIEYDDKIRQDIMTENDRLMTHYLKFLEILIGKDGIKEVAGKSKSGMPGSPAQCVRYFHDMLHYKVVQRGKETKKGIRNPSLGRKALLKLRLQYDNPVIDICMIYRELAKESGSLKFTPWKA